MGKGGDKPELKKGRKISLEELSAHRTPEDGKLAQLFGTSIVSHS